jgi:signal transduction histidine kinase
LLAAFGTILISLWFAQTLIKPIHDLTQGATALAEGDLRTRIRIRAARELEQLATAFNFMADRLMRVMEDQRAFVADAAHELRTPLTTIRLRAEALREGANENPQVAKKFLEDIESETDRLSRLVDQLIELSRIETGLIEPRREPIAMREIAQGVATGMEARAQQQQVTIQVDSATQLPPISADPDQMRQIFFNLIGNAVKFTSQGGEVRVSWAIEKRVNELITTVRDTGIGVGPGDLPHIFDRFYRADKARARATGGAGLGLAIVKSIIDAHGGRVWAESEKDKGTAIMFALPMT